MSYDDNNLKSRNSQMYFDSLYRDKRQRHTPKNHILGKAAKDAFFRQTKVFLDAPPRPWDPYVSKPVVRLLTSVYTSVQALMNLLETVGLLSGQPFLVSQLCNSELRDRD